jgi:hypothetical protein
MTADTFDWGQIPYETWMEFARMAGADERNAKFAAAKFRGCTNTEAARQGGYGRGGGTSTRSEGYRVARSNKIKRPARLVGKHQGAQMRSVQHVRQMRKDEAKFYRQFLERQKQKAEKQKEANAKVDTRKVRRD